MNEKNRLGVNACQPTASFRAELAETRNPSDDRGPWIPKPAEAKTNPEKIIIDRASGAIMAALIGDALALGPHWHYDLSELRRDYGEWIDDYTDPKPGRYHDGLKAGQPSQAGFILALMLRYLVSSGGYDEEYFRKRMDTELFPLLDGTPVSGPGNYTSQSIREAWRRRVEQGLDWGQTGGHADTTEAIERTMTIAVCYAKDHRKLAWAISGNFQGDYS